MNPFLPRHISSALTPGSNNKAALDLPSADGRSASDPSPTLTEYGPTREAATSLFTPEQIERIEQDKRRAALAADFFRFTQNPASMADEEAAWDYLDRFSEDYWHVKAVHGNTWRREGTSFKPFNSPRDYADTLARVASSGYTGYEVPEDREFLEAFRSGDRDAQIKAAGISTTKLANPGGSLMILPGSAPKSDEEIDDELQTHAAAVLSRRFDIVYRDLSDDFDDDDHAIVLNAIARADGLDPADEAKFARLLDPKNPQYDKAARISRLIDFARANDPDRIRDLATSVANTWNATFGGSVNPFDWEREGAGQGLRRFLADRIEQSALEAVFIDQMNSSEDMEYYWNDDEKTKYRELSAQESARLAALNERGLGNPAIFSTFTPTGQGQDPRAAVNAIAARRMAYEALPQTERYARRRQEIAMREALQHRIYDGYSWLGWRAVMGAASTLPYMAATAVPGGIGFASNVASHFEQMRDEMVSDGVDPDEALGAQVLASVAWAAMEKFEYEGFMHNFTPLEKSTFLSMALKGAADKGRLKALGTILGDATRRQAAGDALKAWFREAAATSIFESIQEGAQGALEGGMRQWFKPGEQGGHDWRKALDAAASQGIDDFVESIPSMFYVGGVSAARGIANAHRNRTNAESLIDYAQRKQRAASFLDGTMDAAEAEKTPPEEKARRAAKLYERLRAEWQRADDKAAAMEEIAIRENIPADQAARLAQVFAMQDELLDAARTDPDPGNALAVATIAGGGWRIGSADNGAIFDVQAFYDLAMPGTTVEEVSVPNVLAPTQETPSAEQLAARKELEDAQAALAAAKAGSARRGAERAVRRAKRHLAAANRNHPGVPLPPPTENAVRVTLPNGLSYIVRTDTADVDIDSLGYAQSVAQATKGLDAEISADAFMSLEHDEKQAFIDAYGLKSSGVTHKFVTDDQKELLGAQSIVTIKRAFGDAIRPGGNWTLAHEHGHALAAYLEATGQLSPDQLAVIQRLFPTTSANERWNEEALNDAFANYLRDKYDFKWVGDRVAQRQTKSIFRRIYNAIKSLFVQTGEEPPVAPVERNERERAEDALFDAFRTGDFSGLDQFAGIDFNEDKTPATTPREDARPTPREGAQSAPAHTNPTLPAPDETEPDTAEPPPAPPESPTAQAKPSPQPTTPSAAAAPTAAPVAGSAQGAPAPDTAALRAQLAALQEQLAADGEAAADNLPRRTGTKLTISTPNYAMHVEAEMTWVPLADLIESTDDREVQMRDRSRRATDNQVHNLTRPGVFYPLALFPSSKSDDGAPIIGGGNRIISGHGRKRMLDTLAREGRFNEYLSAVNAEARRRGIPTAPEGMVNPVLVSRITGGLDKREDLTRFAELSNRWGGLERSAAEHAESDARKITDALLRLYSPDASGNLLAASNRPFMAAFLKEVGATGLTNADGTPTAEAALRVQRAMMTALFGNDDKVRSMVRDLMERNQELSLASLQNALMRSAGKLLAMKRQRGSFDIVPQVREAAYHYIAWKAQQQRQDIPFRDYFAEQANDMFSAAASPVEEALALLLDAGRFASTLDKYSELVAQQAVDAQNNLSFAPPRTPLQLIGFAERAVIAPDEAPVTPDPESPEAAQPIPSPLPLPQPSATVRPVPGAEAHGLPWRPSPLSTGTASLPGPGAAGIQGYQVDASGNPSTPAKSLPAGAYNLLRPPYDPKRPPAPSAQDRAGRGLGIANPPPTAHNDIFPHFQGNKTEMADRTTQAIRNTMTDAERKHYTHLVDYFGGGGCWGLYHALENFPNVSTLVINEFDPDRLGKIRLLHEIDGRVADEAAALIDRIGDRLRKACIVRDPATGEERESQAPTTIAEKLDELFKREFSDPRERAVLQAFIDCASTMFGPSPDAEGRVGKEKALAALREDGRKAKDAADEFKRRKDAKIIYRAGDASDFYEAPKGDKTVAVADPPYYLTAGYNGQTTVPLDAHGNGWDYHATRNLLQSLVDNGDAIVYTDEAWWHKEDYKPDLRGDMFSGGESTFDDEQRTLLDIINSLDHFDVAGRVAGRQEVLGIHHGHATQETDNATDTQPEVGEDFRPADTDAASDRGGTPRPGQQPLRRLASVPQGQDGSDGPLSPERRLSGGEQALATELAVQQEADRLLAADPSLSPDAAHRAARFSVVSNPATLEAEVTGVYTKGKIPASQPLSRVVSAYIAGRGPSSGGTAANDTIFPAPRQGGMVPPGLPGGTPSERLSVSSRPMRADDLATAFLAARHSVNPNLYDDVQKALAKRTPDNPDAKQMGRHDEVEFAAGLDFLDFIGMPNGRIVSDATHIRKFAAKHHLTPWQITELASRCASPVAAMKDADKCILLTDMLASTDNGETKPVRVLLSPKVWKSGEVVFIATALAENANDEKRYYEPHIKNGLVFCDKNRIAGLGLEEETESILRTQASGDNVKTAEDYSSWSSPHNIPYPPAPRQGATDRHSAHRTSSTPRSTKDFALAYIAARSLAGKEVKPDDASRLLNSLGIRDTTAAEALAQAQALADRKRTRITGEPNTHGVTRLTEALLREQDAAKIDDAIAKTITAAAKAADPDAGRRVQQAMQRHEARSLSAAHGFTAAEMEADFGFSLADAILDAAALRHGDTPAERPDTASDENRDRIDALRDTLERARFARRAFVAAQNDNRAKQGKAPIDTSPLMDADGLAALADPALATEFITQWAADHIVAKHPEIPNSGQMWKNPVAVRELVQTAAHLLRSLAAQTLGQPQWNWLRNRVDHAINDLERSTTRSQIRNATEATYATLLDSIVRLQRALGVKAEKEARHQERIAARLREKAIKALVNGRRIQRTDPETGDKSLFTIPGIRQLAGTAGRFSAIDEDMKRKVTARVEQWARWVEDAVQMTPTQLDKAIEECQGVISAHNAYDPETGEFTAPADNTQSYRDAVDRLAVLETYGNLRDRPLGVITDTASEILRRLSGERQQFELKREQDEQRRDAIRQTFIAAMQSGAANDAGAVRRALRALSDNRFANALNGNLVMEIRALLRFCRDDDLYKKSLAIVQEWEVQISEASSRARAYTYRARKELSDILASIYGSAMDGIRHLDEPVPQDIEDAIFGQDQTPDRRPHTYGNLLALYAATIQRDYATDDEESPRFRRMQQLETIRAALTPQDIALHAAAVDFLHRHRQILSPAVEEMTGLPVLPPDPNYFPVQPRRSKRSGVGEEIDAWSPIPPQLSRRVTHALDFDERADFFTLLTNNIDTASRTIGYGPLGIELRETLVHGDTLNAARDYVGERDMSRIQRHLRDVLTQGGRAAADVDFLKPLLVARQVTTAVALGFNIPSAIKQLASMPVWANAMLGGSRVGFSAVLRYLTNIDTAAVREILASDWAVARWGLGMSAEVADVLTAPSRNAINRFLQKATQWGLAPNQAIDRLACVWMAQGFYRDATQHYLDMGLNEADAKRKALALTAAECEQGQQSSRIENLNSAQRDRGLGGAFARLAFQFRTAVLLQNNYLQEALRDLAAGGAAAKNARSTLLRAAIVNLVLVPAYSQLVTTAWKALLGDEPPEEEGAIPQWFKDFCWAAIDGTTSSVFYANTLIHAAFDSKGAFAANIPGLETPVRIANHGRKLVVHAAQAVAQEYDIFDIEEEVTAEKLRDDLIRLAKDLSPIARHGFKFYENRTKED